MKKDQSQSILKQLDTHRLYQLVYPNQHLTYKNSSKLGNTVFWKATLKRNVCWKFLVQPPQNSGPVKSFGKLNGNHLLVANIFKLQEYQTFGLMKIHNMCKFWFANKIFSLWKSLVHDYQVVKNGIYNFWFFPLPKF